MQLVLIGWVFIMFAIARTTSFSLASFGGRRLKISTRRLVSTSSSAIVEGDMKQTLLNLISLGDIWIGNRYEKNLNINHLSEKDGYFSVPGCMAAVRVKVSIDDNNLKDVIVTGTADSRVALGMLAYLSQVRRSSIFL